MTSHQCRSTEASVIPPCEDCRAVGPQRDLARVRCSTRLGMSTILTMDPTSCLRGRQDNFHGCRLLMVKGNRQQLDSNNNTLESRALRTQAISRSAGLVLISLTILRLVLSEECQSKADQLISLETRQTLWSLLLYKTR